MGVNVDINEIKQQTSNARQQIEQARQQNRSVQEQINKNRQKLSSQNTLRRETEGLNSLRNRQQERLYLSVLLILPNTIYTC